MTTPINSKGELIELFESDSRMWLCDNWPTLAEAVAGFRKAADEAAERVRRDREALAIIEQALARMP